MSDRETSQALGDLGFEHALADGPPHQIEVLALARQVHGARLVRAPADEREQADALFTSEPGVAVGVLTADCVPVLLAHEGGAGVAAIHAGWRGSAAAICERATREFCAALGVRASELCAVVGPHIGACCYEVDAPVRNAIPDGRVFHDSAKPGHYMLDLFALNRLQLIAAGIAAERVWRVGGCTCCDPKGYPSYRRDRASGRMTHWVRQPSS